MVMEEIKRLEKIKQEFLEAAKNNNYGLTKKLWAEITTLMLAALFKIYKIKVNHFKIEDLFFIKQAIISKYKYNISEIDIFFDFLENYLKQDERLLITNDKNDFGISFCINWLNRSLDVANDIKPETLTTNFSLKYLSIEKYQTIENILIDDIKVDTQFIVLTGDNGNGKTSMLQAIAIGLMGNFDEPSKRILCHDKNTKIGVLCYDHDATQIATFIGANQNVYHSSNIPFIAYGASRLQLQNVKSQNKTPQSNIYGLFTTESILDNIEYWFQTQTLKKAENRIKKVKEILLALLPSIQDIIIGKETIDDEFAILYVENGLERRAEELSAGNKSVLAMIGDMIIRFYKLQPKAETPSQFYGIVAIDEFETHLHPKWQKEFPTLLAKFFPHIQFILSTHSPIIFLGLPPNSAFLKVYKDPKGFTKVKKLAIDIANILPNEILNSSLFELENIRNIHNKGIEFLSVETMKEQTQRQEKELNLKNKFEKFKFQLPQK